LKCVCTLEGHTNFVLCLRVLSNSNSNDQLKLASGSADKKIKIWLCNVNGGGNGGGKGGGAKTSECIQTLSGHSGWINSIEIIFDSENQLLSCSHDKTVKLWNLVDGTCIRTFQGHTEYVYCIRTNAEGKLISGSNDKSIRIWDINTGKCIQTINGTFKVCQNLLMCKLNTSKNNK